MGLLSAVAVAEIKARGSINNVDVRKLRRNCHDSRITADEAGIIFSLNDACPVQDPAWADWFVETLTDFVVDQAKPAGYLTSDNAAWLVARISRDGDGLIANRTAMDLVLSVLDRARWSPMSLVRFALDQVKHAVIDAAGPLRSGRPPGIVSEPDVALLRHIMGSLDGDLPVTRPEAEVLFDLDAATGRGENHPAWRDLLVKAVANCVLAASGYVAPPRKLVLSPDPWLDRRLANRRTVGAGSGSKGPFGGYRRQSAEERDIARLTRQKIEIVTHEPVPMADATWLAARIGCGGAASPNARALLAFLKGESPVLHPTLQALVDKGAVAH